MQISYPKYYQTFQCIASACPDSCCKEWEVDVDDASAAFYRSLPGDLGDSLRQVLKDTDTGVTMTIQNGRCPMWQQDGLCRIQAALGHAALCQTCRDFPRLRHDYGDFVELGLELSCPEAARLILTQPHDICTDTIPGGEEAEYDQNAMDILLQSREEILGFWEGSSLPIPQRLAVILLYGHKVQNWLDFGEEAVPCQEEALALLAQLEAPGNWELLLSFFAELEILTPQWANRLKHPDMFATWNEGQIPLLKYLIRRHWLQAVSDYDLIGRVKFMVAACLLVHRLGGNFAETAQLFSKEIENDIDNLEAILDGAYTAPALTDMNLLALLKTT